MIDLSDENITKLERSWFWYEITNKINLLPRQRARHLGPQYAQETRIRYPSLPID